MKRAIRIERVYPHDVRRVWRALTTPELLERWLMPNDFVAEVGHEFTFRTDPGPGFDGIVHCRVLELVEERRLAFSWRGGPLDTRVAFELEPVAAGTRLTVEHTGFRGLRARLVGLILEIGSRKLYGEHLPRVLDELARTDGGPPPPNDAGTDPACMSWHQRLVAAVLRLLTPRER